MNQKPSVDQTLKSVPQVLTSDTMSQSEWRNSTEPSFWLLLGAGASGIALSIWLTSPLVTFAALFFAEICSSLADPLIRSRVFETIVADWRVSGAIDPRYKVMVMVMMAGAFGASFAMSIPTPVLFVQVLCMSAAVIFILSCPNWARQENYSQRRLAVSRKHV